MKLIEIKSQTENEDATNVCYADLEIPQYWGSLDGLVERYKIYQYVPGCKLMGKADFHKSKITNLKGCPSYIKNYFDLSGCSNLETLEGGPAVVNGNLYLNNCVFLSTLKHAPKSVAFLKLDYCTRLISLKGLPKRIKTSLSLEGCSSLINILHILLTEFKVPQNCLLYASNLHSNIPKDLEAALEIIETHLSSGADLLDCKAELIEKGLSKYSKL